MKTSRHVDCLRLWLVIAMMGTGLSGLAHASDWMDVRLGLPPLQFEQSGEIQRSYLQSLSHSSDIQTYGGAAGGDEPMDLEALSKKMDNPLGSLWLLFVQNDMIRLSDDFPMKRKRWVNVTLLQPILPVPLGSDWLLVNRPTIPLIKAPIPKLDTSGQGRFPPVGPGGGGPEFSDLQNRVSTNHQFELGDIIYPMWIAPRELPKVGGGNLIWGVGPTWIFPTATHDFVGGGKWAVGPTGLVVWDSPDWKLGVVAQQWWSFAGKDDRPSVKTANIQYLIYRQLPNLWQVGMGPNVLVDWNADDGNKLTFPVGLGVNKTTVLFGKLPVRLGAEVHYSAIQPDDVGQTWLFRIYAVPVVPSPFAN